MTTKIKWRLSKLPSVEEVSLLVEKGVLKNEEAREILFSHETEEDRDKKSLQDEIKFLREMVQRLTQSRTQLVETIRYVEKPFVNTPWYPQYQTFCDNQTGFSGLSTVNLSNQSVLTSTAGTSLTYSGADLQQNFTDIKTF